MGATLYAWRVGWRRSWQLALAVALIGGLLGAAAMAALAGARRTDSAYGRYLQAARASDVMIDIPGPLLGVVRQVEGLHGRLSAAAWLGLNAYPVIDGKIDPSFQTDAIAASLGGEYFRQDKMTVLAGKLPALDSTDEIAVTEPMAKAFGLHPGSHMTWQFYRGKIDPDGLPTSAAPAAAQRTTFVVTAITAAPPALGDQFDDIDGAILPPAATPTYLNGEWGFGWVAMRLRGGAAGLPAIQRQLAALERKLSEKYHFPIYFDIRVLAIVQHEAQQAIEPEADALAVLGGLIALATLVLVGQGLTQMLSRSAADGTILRAMGATRGEAALALAGPGCAAIAGSAVLSAAGAIALSPLAPVGPVRAYDPQTGVRADWLVLGAGTLALLLLLGGVLTWLSWRAAGQAGSSAGRGPGAAADDRVAPQRRAHHRADRYALRTRARVRAAAGAGPGDAGRLGGRRHGAGRLGGVQLQPERACLSSRSVWLELGDADPVASRLGSLGARLHDLDHGASARHHRMV